jgi:hypothetical protein
MSCISFWPKERGIERIRFRQNPNISIEALQRRVLYSDFVETQMNGLGWNLIFFSDYVRWVAAIAGLAVGMREEALLQQGFWVLLAFKSTIRNYFRHGLCLHKA